MSPQPDDDFREHLCAPGIIQAKVRHLTSVVSWLSRSCCPEKNLKKPVIWWWWCQWVGCFLVIYVIHVIYMLPTCTTFYWEPETPKQPLLMCFVYIQPAETFHPSHREVEWCPTWASTRNCWKMIPKPQQKPHEFANRNDDLLTQLLVFLLQSPATESETGYHPATETRGVDIHSNFQEGPSKKRHKTSQHWLRKKREWRCLNDPMITQLVLRENAFACESCQQMQDCLAICRNHLYLQLQTCREKRHCANTLLVNIWCACDMYICISTMYYDMICMCIQT